MGLGFNDSESKTVSFPRLVCGPAKGPGPGLVRDAHLSERCVPLPVFISCSGDLCKPLVYLCQTIISFDDPMQQRKVLNLLSPAG